ncbi:MAG: hypothetical protein QW835_05965 [Candidatus Hadarchaeum sp.]|uniref:hypothetical protein n=1 Tax=Candidatus Hadarchaeum sp. TaxID=2883567 RepID=UPI00317421D3
MQDAGKRFNVEKADLSITPDSKIHLNGAKIKDFGAVCDVSVLINRDSFETAKRIVAAGGLYLPSATYSWLARDKLISVRNLIVGYSLINQFVRDGELIVVYLPELLDEISRRLLYGADREIPLTDLRASMLAAHLKMPILTFSSQFTERLSDHLGARTIWQLNVLPNHGSMLAAIDLYWELASELGGYLARHQNNGDEFEALVEEIKRLKLDNLRTKTSQISKSRPHQSNSERLNLVYIGLDITTFMREYLEQHIIQPEAARKLYEKSLLLIACLED